VGRVGIVDWAKAEAFVKAGGSGIFSAQTDAVEVLAGVVDEGGHEGPPCTKIPPYGANIDAANAADGGVAGERVEVEAADSDEGVALD
jgi:hypothetical protein